MNWAFEDANGNSYGDVTGYASTSGTTFQYQDGYPAGSCAAFPLMKPALSQHPIPTGK